MSDNVAVQEETTYTKLEQQHYADINDRAKQVAALGTKADVAKEKAKVAKQHYDAAVAELQELILRGPNPQPLLPGMGETGERKTNDAWRAVSVTELGVSEGILGAMEEAGLTTLGKLADAMDGDQWWRSIAGIGEGKATQIEDAFSEFWANNPQYCADAPSRVRILKDIPDDGLKAGDEYEVLGWSDDGEPKIETAQAILYLQVGDWEAC